MSSADVIKSVSKKLKYYFQVKRLEDGFDLSTSDCPRLDHPPTKARPTLNYSGLHDRPLKHYFNQPDVRVTLTQFKAPDGKKSREHQVKRAVQSNIRRYQFVEPPKKPKNKPPHMMGAYYVPPRKGTARRTHPGLTGFGTPLKKKKSNIRTGYPVLRSVPPRQVSRGEAQRLINMATRLLVATETIDLGENGGGGRRRAASAKERNSGAPKPFESLPPLDNTGINRKGRAKSAQQRGNRYQDPDSAYDSPNDASSPTGDQKGEVPVWLRRQMKKVELEDNESGTENQWVRPHSGYTTNVPKPPDDDRPRSATIRNSRRSSSSNSPRNGWGSEKSFSSSTSEESTSSAGSSRTPAKEDEGVQTGGELLKKYEPMDQVLRDGERSNFRIHVHTGNRLGASTRADIRLILYGDKGRTQELFLSDSRNHKINFQKGQEDIFDVYAISVGPVRKIAIGHDRKEISFGWYLDKVHIKDRGAGMQYFVQCDRWLSSREGDGRTFNEFGVTESMTYNPGPDGEQEDFTPVKVDNPQIKYEAADSTQDGDDDRSIQGRTDTSSNTSLATNYSDREDEKRKQRRDSSSSSSSYTSASSSTYTADSQDGRKSPEHKTPRTPTTPTVRKDDFFDQRPAGKDYSSVIDSLSTTTDQDNKHDFENDRPSIYSRQPSNKGPTLKAPESTEDSRQVQSARSTDSEEPLRPKTSLGYREPDGRKDSSTFLDGFKAGIEAAKKSEEIAEHSDSASTSSNDYSATPAASIHQAAKSGDIATVRKLIDKNPSLKTSTDEKGWQPIHTSSAAGHVDIVKWLAVNSVNLDEMTPTGYTAMHLAAMNGQTNTMIVLVALGAKIGSKSVEHQTPLHLAAMSGHLETVKFLVGNKADLKEADNLGRMPLDLAEEYQHQDIVDFLKACNKEESNPNSGLALLRKDSSTSDKPRNTFPPLSGQKPASPRASSDTTSSSSSSSSDSNSESDSEEQAKSKSTVAHDPELMEKKKLYDQQQQRQSKNVSFLDTIRAEYNDDDF